MSKDGFGKMAAPKWFWKTLRIDDRVLTDSKWKRADQNRVRDWTSDDDRFETARLKEAKRLRWNFLAVEVRPSLDHKQAYKAQVWIETQSHADHIPPDRVEWASNKHHFRKIHVCNHQNDPQFNAVFAYYGPTLSRARLIWKDREANAFIYARIPRED